MSAPTYCGGFTSQGHGLNAVCGEPEWGPASKIHQCAGCMIADLKRKCEWQPIESAPKDGTEVIVGFDRACTWIVHAAWWRTGEEHGCTAEDRGWWSYTLGSVTQEQLDEDRAPTHWIPMPDTPT